MAVLATRPTSLVPPRAHLHHMTASPPSERAAGALARRFPKTYARADRLAQSRWGAWTRTAWTRRRPIALALVLTSVGVRYALARREEARRDYVWPDTYLVWKVHDGCIVESRRPPSIKQLMAPVAPGDEPPRVMELYEVLHALRWAQRDERIRGIVADFSSLHVPTAVAPERLGLAQTEEILQALVRPPTDQREFRAAKRVQFPSDAYATVAWTDTFSSQGAYLLASGFDRVYVQPTGQVPLVGLASQIPFFRRLLTWAGIEMHAEARTKYKSMVSPFTEVDSLPPAQLANQAELLGELSQGYARALGAHRFPQLPADEAAERVLSLAHRGPFSAREAEEAGLIDGTCFRRDIVEELVPETKDDDVQRWKTLAHYTQLNEQTLARTLSDDQVVKVGVIYLLGSLSNASGPHSVGAAIEGLKEVGADPAIHSVVLRIDSGGGDVVASESLWDAVRRLRRDHNKHVVCSFGNTAASGAYYVATAADAIFADQNTVTGSIGVAALRPAITQKLLDRLHMHVQTFFTGSTAGSLLHTMDAKQEERMAQHIDETYDAFLAKVCEGRAMARDAVEQVAGGRVMTGLAAYTLCDGAHAPVSETLAAWKRETDGGVREWHTHREAGASGIEAVHIGHAPAAVPEDDEAVQATALAADLAALQPAPAFGRGLVDALGGLWDAALYATAITLEAELDALKQTGLTDADALKQLRPACARTGEGASTSLSADVRLVRYPVDQPFWHRLQQYDLRTEPSMAVALVRPFLAWYHAQTTPSSWHELLRECEEGVRTHTHARIYAEYPFRTPLA